MLLRNFDPLFDAIISSETPVYPLKTYHRLFRPFLIGGKKHLGHGHFVNC